VSHTAAELVMGRQLAVQYRDMARSIEEEAKEHKLKAMPLTRRILGQYAAIARRAAIAEEVHPDSPEPPACSICGRTRSCLAVSG
jgi:hypothetical protein